MAIESANAFYEILRHYMNIMFPMAYSNVEYVGLNKLPSDGAIILAPNHTNALMDALTILTVTNKPTVFVSRADIFKQREIAKILNFFKIMPIMRRRDGISNLKKNDEIMAKAVKVLQADVPFCIFSEGTHRMMHSLLPITKGIFRIALQCNDALHNIKPVYIVPIGIEYGSYTKFRHSLLVTIGDSINVTEYVDNHKDLEVPELINSLRDVLTNNIKQLFHYVRDDDYYNTILDLCYLRNSSLLASTDKCTLSDVVAANKQTINDINSWQDNNTKLDDILVKMTEFAKTRRQLGVNDTSLYSWPTKFSILKRLILGGLVLPYVCYCFIVSLPALAIQWLLIRNLEDKAFANSYRFVVLLLIVPLCLIIFNVTLFCILPWYYAALFGVLAIPAYTIVIDFANKCNNIISDYKLMKSSKLQKLWFDVKKLIDEM